MRRKIKYLRQYASWEQRLLHQRNTHLGKTRIIGFYSQSIRSKRITRVLVHLILLAFDFVSTTQTMFSGTELPFLKGDGDMQIAHACLHGLGRQQICRMLLNLLCFATDSDWFLDTIPTILFLLNYPSSVPFLAWFLFKTKSLNLSRTSTPERSFWFGPKLTQPNAHHFSFFIQINFTPLFSYSQCSSSYCPFSCSTSISSVWPLFSYELKFLSKYCVPPLAPNHSQHVRWSSSPPHFSLLHTSLHNFRKARFQDYLDTDLTIHNFLASTIGF